MKRAVLFQIHKGGIRRLQHSNAAETAKKSQFSLQKSSELAAPLESNPRTSEGHPRTGAAAGWALHQKCLPRVSLRCEIFYVAARGKQRRTKVIGLNSFVQIHLNFQLVRKRSCIFVFGLIRAHRTNPNPKKPSKFSLANNLNTGGFPGIIVCGIWSLYWVFTETWKSELSRKNSIRLTTKWPCKHSHWNAPN